MRCGFPSAHVCSHFAEEGLRYHQVNAVGRDAIAEVQAHFASTARSVESKLQPRTDHAGIAEVSAGKRVAEVVHEGAVGLRFCTSTSAATITRSRRSRSAPPDQPNTRLLARPAGAHPGGRPGPWARAATTLLGKIMVVLKSRLGSARRPEKHTGQAPGRAEAAMGGEEFTRRATTHESCTTERGGDSAADEC